MSREYFIEKVVDIYVADAECGEVPTWDDASVKDAFTQWAAEEDIDVPSMSQCRRYITEGKRQYLEQNPCAKIESDPDPDEPAPEQPEIDRVDGDHEPDEYIEDSEFPGYATNWDGTVISLGGPRRKKGARLTPTVTWLKTPSGKWYPQAYYRLRKDGETHNQTHGQLLMRRVQTLKERQKALLAKSSLLI